MITRLAWLVMTLVLGIGAAQASTLQQVREKGTVTCGVSTGRPGLSRSDGASEWTGLFPDFCRAVAAAVLADPAKVTFVPLAKENAFASLRAGEIDLLSQPTAWTFKNDTGHDPRFVGALYYASYGMLVPRQLGVATALELSGAEICVSEDSPAAMHVADYFRRNNMPLTLVPFARAGDALQAYDAGRCDVYAGELASLDARKQQLASPEAHLVLRDVVGVEPLGPAVRRGDPQWIDIVRWTLFALIKAEEMQINSENIADARASTSPLVRRFLGVDGALGHELGLDPQWAFNIIATVGNYREVFARNLGAYSALGRERHLNRLWTEGGILYAPPIR